MKMRSIFCIVLAVLMLAMTSGCSLIGVSDEEKIVSSADSAAAEPDVIEEENKPEPEVEVVVYSHEGHSAGRTVEMPARIGGEMKKVDAEHIEMYDGLVVMDKISEFVRSTEGADEFFYREADIIDNELKANFVINYTPNDRAEVWVDTAEVKLHDFYSSVERKTIVIDGVEAVVLEMSGALDGSEKSGFSGYIDLEGGLIYVSANYTSDTVKSGDMMRAMLDSLTFPKEG